MHPFDHPTTQAVARIIDENNLLIGGASRQAAIIRQRGERISQLEAQLTEAQYQIELVKAQGRKTRSKVRGLKKALSDSQNHLGQALSRAERAERNHNYVRRFMRPELEQENMRLSAELGATRQVNEELIRQLSAVIAGQPLVYHLRRDEF